MSFVRRVLPIYFLLTCTGPAADKISKAKLQVEAARECVQSGAFEKSVDCWRKAADLYQQSNDPTELIQANLGLATSYYELGRIKLALGILNDTLPIAEGLKEANLLAAVHGELGAVQMLSFQAGDAEANLNAALTTSRQLKNHQVAAKAAMNLGVLETYRGDFPAAIAYYEEATALAEQSGQTAIAAKSRANLAAAALQKGDFSSAETKAKAAVADAIKLPDSHQKCYVLINASRTFNGLFLKAPSHDNQMRLKAFESLKIAGDIAEAIGDRVALSYAIGYEGELYEQERRFAEALQLTRRAVFLAQQAKSPDCLYRWEWQEGRLLHAQKEDGPAIAAYRRAVAILESIRHDVSLHYGNAIAASTFRAVAGNLYFELADLILQATDSEKEAGKVQQMLLEARNQVEQLKSAELEDYFQDACVNLLKSKVKSVEAVSPTTALLYIIPLPDRTELLVSLNGELKRIKSPVTEAELTQTAHEFRINLEDRTSNLYLEQSQKLYDWLIRPIAPLLDKAKIDTLVFVPDGALRGVPMAALQDGSKFLVQKYAIAVTPGLTLMAPQPFHRDKIDLIINGLSESVQGFESLPFVNGEVASLHKLYGGRELMNKDFVLDKVRQQFTQGQCSIVHIASHGHFDSDAKKTFLLTFDSKLTLNQLEQMLRPSQFKDKPIELLTLSACQTAAGDDRAALGLAGVAIKAGARSAFATLWYINDQASATLVSDFYSALASSPTLTKAAALQTAQVKLLSDGRYEHPCYWAPYLIIGNWL